MRVDGLGLGCYVSVTAAGSYYADDLCITTQQSAFQHVELTLELALDEMSI